MIYFLQIVLKRHIFSSVNVPIRLGWGKLYHSIFWWWPIMWKIFFLLIWNGTSWNTENCWNFWPNCFGLWGISFWKRKNGSGTPCISHSLEILNPLKMTTQYLFLTLKIMLKSRLICIAFGQKFLKNMFHQQIVLCKGPKVMRTKFIIWTVRP